MRKPPTPEPSPSRPRRESREGDGPTVACGVGDRAARAGFDRVLPYKHNVTDVTCMANEVNGTGARTRHEAEGARRSTNLVGGRKRCAL
eukprot:575930-Prymnesium_polylepis.1